MHRIAGLSDIKTAPSVRVRRGSMPKVSADKSLDIYNLTTKKVRLEGVMRGIDKRRRALEVELEETREKIGRTVRGLVEERQGSRERGRKDPSLKTMVMEY